MKFELTKYNRNTTDQELLEDLIRVATQLNIKTLTIDQYLEKGNKPITDY